MLTTQLTGTSPEEAERVAREAVKRTHDRFIVLRTVGYAVVLDTGRNFYDGTPVTARLWIPTEGKSMVVVGDGGQTYARLGEAANSAPDYAISVRNEILEHLPVQDILGQVAIMAKVGQASEAISILADSCIALDVAVIAANHLRPKR